MGEEFEWKKKRFEAMEKKELKREMVIDHIVLVVNTI